MRVGLRQIGRGHESQDIVSFFKMRRPRPQNTCRTKLSTFAAITERVLVDRPPNIVLIYSFLRQVKLGKQPETAAHLPMPFQPSDNRSDPPAYVPS